MKNEIIHWFDLDGTLWNTNSMWWIVDKKDPANALLRISQYEGNLILSGYYKNFGHTVNYNGLTGWLSEETWLKIQRKRKIKAEDLGISYREYQDKHLIEHDAVELIVYIDRIKHLEGTKDIVNILTARGNHESHKNLLGRLQVNLDPLGITINDAYFISDPTIFQMYGTTPEKKMICILEKIVGHKIEDNCFVPLLTDKYDVSHFYDDEDKNIEACKNINHYMRDYLANTQPWLKQRIEEDIARRKPKLVLNIVNTNELNPFDVEEVEVKII